MLKHPKKFLKLCQMILRYCFVSLTSSAIDFFVFILMQHTGASLGKSFFIARLVSSSYGYPMSRRFVFHSNRRLSSTIAEYYLLVFLSGMLSFNATKLLITHAGISHITAKAMSEVLFFISNFIIQKFFIFFRVSSKQPATLKNHRHKKKISDIK